MEKWPVIMWNYILKIFSLCMNLHFLNLENFFAFDLTGTDQLWFCFLFVNVSYDTLKELGLKIECIYYICFPLFQTVWWEWALMNVHFFSQLKYWQFGVADTVAFDSVLLIQCAVWNISRLNQQSRQKMPEPKWLKNRLWVRAGSSGFHNRHN